MPDPNLLTALKQLRQAARLLNKVIKAGKDRETGKKELAGVEAICNVVIMRIK